MLTAEEFGKTKDGESVTLLRLTNAHGAMVELISYGCALKRVAVPDRDGVLTDVCAGFDTLAGYEASDAKMGAIIGRTSGRIKNARFTLNGKEYLLSDNAEGNNLHGGPTGFDRRVWQWRARGDGVIFSRRSPDGEEGYPGTLDSEISYEFSDSGVLTIGYLAVCDADTYCSLTNHAYWNLGCPVDDTLLRVHADSYVEAGDDLLPTGRLLSVAGTAFDHRDFAPIGAAVLDHSFPLPGEGLRPACELRNDANGISLAISTTLPSIHVYTGNFLPVKRSSVALEAQYIPNGMNSDVFPAPLLPAGQVWHHRTVLKFN